MQIPCVYVWQGGKCALLLHDKMMSCHSIMRIHYIRLYLRLFPMPAMKKWVAVSLTVTRSWIPPTNTWTGGGSSPSQALQANDWHLNCSIVRQFWPTANSEMMDVCCLKLLTAKKTAQTWKTPKADFSVDVSKLPLGGFSQFPWNGHLHLLHRAVACNSFLSFLAMQHLPLDSHCHICFSRDLMARTMLSPCWHPPPTDPHLIIRKHLRMSTPTSSTSR